MPDPQPLDGLSAPDAAPEALVPKPSVTKTPSSPQVKRWKMILITTGILFYILYALWGMTLLVILPSADPQIRSLIPLGLGSALLAGLALFAVGGFGLMRISGSKTSPKTRQFSLIKLIAIITPGILLSLVLPFMILREPPLYLDITSPATTQEMVAPVSMSFSVERAVATLGLEGIKVTQYRWDVNNDGKADQQTVTPKLTVNYDKEGVYRIAATLVTSAGTRVVARNFTIQQAVFTILPNPPIIERPVVFSILNLVKDKQILSEVGWDFNDDGKIDETTKNTDITYTFYKEGPVKISATIKLTNNTQATYSRTITIQKPEPLPFPIKIISDPVNLISPAPFTVLLRVDTKEPLDEVEWIFGDGDKEPGERVIHEFKTEGTYLVTAKVRAKSGTSASLDTIVRVVEDLPLQDLAFESDTPITGNSITGTVPLRLDITPRTSVPFVQFSWEAPAASELGSVDTTLQAVYRKEGTYKLTLIAQDLGNHAMRRTFTVTVKPQDATVDFKIVPDNGVAPLTVQLDSSDSSLPADEIPAGYLWKCDDSEPAFVGGGIASCTYTREGTYKVTLTIRTQGGKEFSATKTLIVRPPVITACFLPSRSRAKAGELIAFPLDCSTGTVSNMAILWDFGDRTQLDWKQGDPDAVHAYDKAGNYVVTLTFTDLTDPSRIFKTTRTVTIEP